VQFLNRPKLVMPLVQDPSTRLLLTMMRSLRTQVSRMLDGGSMAARTMLGARRFLPLISDLRFILAIDELPPVLLADGPLLELWSELLASLTSFDMQTRQRGTHVEHEHMEWVQVCHRH
jgi:hypothetical protein